MNKIKFVSLFFRVLFQLIFLAFILLQIGGWIYPQKFFFSVIPSVYQNYAFNEFDINAKIMGFFVTLAPTLLKLLVFYFLIKLFRSFEQHEFFSANNVRYIRNAGYALLLEQIINPASEFLLGFVLTSHNPPGFRLASMSISDTNIGLLLTALIIILISWIMAEGHKLHHEQQLTI